MRGFEPQDEERHQGAMQGFGAGKVPGATGRVGRTDRGGWAGRWLPEQSWGKTARHEPGKDRGAREK